MRRVSREQLVPLEPRERLDPLAHRDQRASLARRVLLARPDQKEHQVWTEDQVPPASRAPQEPREPRERQARLVPLVLPVLRD